MKKGEEARFDGVLLTTPMAVSLDVGMKEVLDKLDEERAFSKEALALEAASCVAAVAAVRAQSEAREALLTKALADEQARAVTAAKETSKEESGHVLWAAGGIAAGLVVGLVAGAGTVMYLTLATP